MSYEHALQAAGTPATRGEKTPAKESAVAKAAQPKIGILLTNLGTPEGTDYWSMRRYLSEFLSDRRVIEIPRLIWFFILNTLILTFRPAAKGKDYEAIWNHDLNESPLKTITRTQTWKLRIAIRNGRFGPGASRIAVDWGMRYGQPSIESAVHRLTEQGCDRLLLVPLYPQYSAATTATACDKTFSVLAKIRKQPALRVAAPYFDESTYIDALVRSVSNGLAGLDFEPEVILASFHGMPDKTRDAGDPYYEQCLRTGDLVRQKLGLSETQFRVTFQSRFGSEPWLTPYTDETVRALGHQGVKRIAVLTPGFSADCLETIDEISRENAEFFRETGGQKFARIACLNASEDGMRVIENIVERELAGWL